MKEKDPEKRYRRYMGWWIAATVLGFVLICMGVIQYFYYGMPEVGVSLRTLQLVIVDGTKPILLGVGLLLASGYRLVHRRKAFEEDIELYTPTRKLEKKGLKSPGLDSKEIKRIKKRRSRK